MRQGKVISRELVGGRCCSGGGAPPPLAAAGLSIQPSTPFAFLGPLHLRAATPEAYCVERRRRARQRTSRFRTRILCPGTSQGSSRRGRVRHGQHETPCRLRDTADPAGAPSHGAFFGVQTGISVSHPARARRSVHRRVDQTAIWLTGSGAGEETQNGCLGCIAQRSDRPGLAALAPVARASSLSPCPGKNLEGAK